MGNADQDLPPKPIPPVCLALSATGFGDKEARALCNSLGFFGVARAEKGRPLTDSADHWLVSAM
jgi:hypothetical protein